MFIQLFHIYNYAFMKHVGNSTAVKYSTVLQHHYTVFHIFHSAEAMWDLLNARR